MKGEVEADIARHTAREAWAAMELFRRLGFVAECLHVSLRYAVAEVTLGEVKPITGKEARLWAIVEIRSLHDNAVLYAHPVAPIGLGQKGFQQMYNARTVAMQQGQMSEDQLRKEYEASDAYAHRDEIINALLDRGFSVRTDQKDETTDPTKLN